MNQIVRIPIESREQWLLNRSVDVTGSEVGALFGIHRYMTAAELYARKIGAIKEDKDLGGPGRRGVKLEPFVAEQVVLRHDNWTIAKNKDYLRDPAHRVGGTPDFTVGSTQPTRMRVLEIKTVGASDFKAIWKGGDAEAEPVPEPWQLLQTQTYMYLTGAEVATIAVMVVGEWEPMDIYEIEVPRHEPAIASIIIQVDEFWRKVDAGISPAFDFERDKDTIKALYASAIPGKKADFRGDAEMQELMERRERYKSVIRAYQADLEPIEAQIIAKIGDAETVLVNGWKPITYKNAHNRGYTVAPFDYRTLRAKREE